ncbi:MAG: ADP-ribosylglycohydrolase family protein [Actinomycetota bacterium]|nr:ADP-ribosylglycohydrolase family protein [Actinomycetota bacterium]
MSEYDSLLDKFKGALLGCAVGDALGAPVEGLPADEISKKFGTVADFVDGNFPAGSISDDTQMTVVIAQSIIEYGRFDPLHTANKLALWMGRSDEGIKEAKNPDAACAEVLRKIYRGSDPLKSGVRSRSAAAASRASPVGLRYFDQWAKLKRASVSQAMITHTDPCAIAGSMAIALAVAIGIADEGNLKSEKFVGEICGFVEETSSEMAHKIKALEELLKSPSESYRYQERTNDSTDAVPAAIYAFLENPYDFSKTVLSAINSGGAASSIASMAGAISGSFNGASGISQNWMDRLEGKKYIESLGFRLFTLTSAWIPKNARLF